MKFTLFLVFTATIIFVSTNAADESWKKFMGQHIDKMKDSLVKTEELYKQTGDEKYKEKATSIKDQIERLEKIIKSSK